jgi:hypothetical protein
MKTNERTNDNGLNLENAKKSQKTTTKRLKHTNQPSRKTTIKQNWCREVRGRGSGGFGGSQKQQGQWQWQFQLQVQKTTIKQQPVGAKRRQRTMKRRQQRVRRQG